MIKIIIDSTNSSEEKLKIMSNHYGVDEKKMIELLILREFNRLKEGNGMQLNNNLVEDYKFKIGIKLKEFLKIGGIRYFIKKSKELSGEALSESTIYDLTSKLGKSKVSIENIQYIETIINYSKK